MSSIFRRIAEGTAAVFFAVSVLGIYFVALSDAVVASGMLDWNGLLMSACVFVVAVSPLAFFIRKVRNE